MEHPPQCTRCGTCCQKGGPAIHMEDRSLIETGRLPLARLFTIREGESAHDNLKNLVLPQPGDIIKIKSQSESASCFYHDEQNKSCKIYSHRPIECTALKCWDTREIELLYDQRRITRRDMIGNIQGLWDLVEDHQSRCPFEPVLALINGMKLHGNKDPLLEKRSVYILQYDLEIRSLVTEKGNIDPEIIDFLFGRPMIQTLRALGVKIRRSDEKIIFSTGA